MHEYKDKKVLVTGGTGLIGRQVVDLLVECGAEVTSISLDDLRLNDKAVHFNLDLSSFSNNRSKFTDLEIFTRLLLGMDYVFHLAGIKASPKITLERPATMSIPPLMINTNVLEACRINGIRNVLFTSSIGAYAQGELLKEENAYIGDPMDFLPGQVKRMAENQIWAYQREFGLNYRVVRLGNTYGIGDNFNPDNAMFIPSLMAKVLRGDNPVEIWGDGSQIRDFAYSKDIARGVLQMMLNAQDCMPINLGAGQGYTVKDVVETLHGITKFEFKFITSSTTGVKRRVLDISKARSLGYELKYSLYEGLKETWEWFKDNSKESEKRLNYFVDKES